MLTGYLTSHLQTLQTVFCGCQSSNSLTNTQRHTTYMHYLHKFSHCWGKTWWHVARCTQKSFLVYVMCFQGISPKDQSSHTQTHKYTHKKLDVPNWPDGFLATECQFSSLSMLFSLLFTCSCCALYVLIAQIHQSRLFKLVLTACTEKSIYIFCSPSLSENPAVLCLMNTMFGYHFLHV